MLAWAEQIPVVKGNGHQALDTGIPLLPLGFFVPADALRSFSKNIQDENRISTSRWQWGSDCSIQIGKPFQRTEEHLHDDLDSSLLQLTERIMTQIAAQVERARQDANLAY